MAPSHELIGRVVRNSHHAGDPGESGIILDIRRDGSAERATIVWGPRFVLDPTEYDHEPWSVSDVALSTVRQPAEPQRQRTARLERSGMAERGWIEWRLEPPGRAGSD